jgi:hypothetical protein
MNNELLIKMITNSWRAQLIATNKIFDNLSDEELLHEVFDGRNWILRTLGYQ